MAKITFFLHAVTQINLQRSFIWIVIYDASPLLRTLRILASDNELVAQCFTVLHRIVHLS